MHKSVNVQHGTFLNVYKPCDHYPDQDMEHFWHPESFLVHTASQWAPHPSPEVLTVLKTSTIGTVLPVVELHINGIIQHGPFCGWLLSLNVIVWKIHHAERSSNSFSLPCILTHSTVNGHTYCFPIWAADILLF